METSSSSAERKDELTYLLAEKMGQVFNESNVVELTKADWELVQQDYRVLSQFLRQTSFELLRLFSEERAYLEYYSWAFSCALSRKVRLSPQQIFELLGNSCRIRIDGKEMLVCRKSSADLMEI